MKHIVVSLLITLAAPSAFAELSSDPLRDVQATCAGMSASEREAMAKSLEEAKAGNVAVANQLAKEAFSSRWLPTAAMRSCVATINEWNSQLQAVEAAKRDVAQAGPASFEQTWSVCTKAKASAGSYKQTEIPSC